MIEMKFQDFLTLGIINKVIKKLIHNKVGVNVDPSVRSLIITDMDGDIRVSINADIRLPRDELVKLTQKN